MQHSLIPNMRFITNSPSVPFLLLAKSNSIKEILKKIVYQENAEVPYKVNMWKRQKN
jgi:hypothetical protein